MQFHGDAIKFTHILAKSNLTIDFICDSLYECFLNTYIFLLKYES